MTSLFLIPLLFTGATHVWVATSLEDIAPGLEAPYPRSEDVRLLAARGEWESFQVCLRSSDKSLEQVTVEPEPLQDIIPAPVLWQVGFLEPEDGAGERLPDPLLPILPFDVPKGETRAVWVSYRVPDDAPPGIYGGKLRLRWGSRAYRDITVTLAVLDFALPPASALTALVDMDARAVEEVLGLSALHVDAWEPLYATLAAYRLTPRLTGVSLPPSALKRHLRLSAAQFPPGIVDLGQAGHQPEDYPQPLLGVLQDPLQVYLQDMLGWMESDLPETLPILTLQPAAERSTWPETREHLFRVRRADDRVVRVLQAPLHPYFERYVSVFAAPFSQALPIAVDRLEQGRSLALEHIVSIEAATASSTGTLTDAGYATVPADACDESMFTAWVSEAAPSVPAPQWIQIAYAEAITVQDFTIWWPRGYEGLDIEVETSAEGSVFSPATTRWDHRLGEAPDSASWSEGSFKVRKPLRAIRFRFAQPTAEGPVAIMEVKLGAEGEQGASRTVAPIAVWLDLEAGAFPTLSTPASGAAARLVPWACWHHGLSGFMGASATAWPRSWRPLVPELPAVWPLPADAGAPLFYPAPGGMLPSVRAERLRDGMEDYAYLIAAEEEKDQAAVLVERQAILEQLVGEKLEAWAQSCLRLREELGHALAMSSQGE